MPNPPTPLLPEIALVTASVMPKPDRDTVFLVAELANLGIRAAILAWDAPISWAAIPLVVLRTPWDYVQRWNEFLSWATDTDSKTHVINPLPLVRWNAHKGYLLELSVRGVPIVPTDLCRPGDPVKQGWLAKQFRNDSEFVVKPAMSSGAG